jgi:heme/copper-type cytochrome/quinol oxidase subunit 2
MPIVVRFVPKDEFQRWLAEMAPAKPAAPAAAAPEPPAAAAVSEHVPGAAAPAKI